MTQDASPTPDPVGDFGISWSWLVILHPRRRIFNFYVSWDCECKVLLPTLELVSIISCARLVQE